MSFSHKIVKKIIGDRKSKNDAKACTDAGCAGKVWAGSDGYDEECKYCEHGVWSKSKKQKGNKK
jgi:hypothetical protein